MGSYFLIQEPLACGLFRDKIIVCFDNIIGVSSFYWEAITEKCLVKVKLRARTTESFLFVINSLFYSTSIKVIFDKAIKSQVPNVTSNLRSVYYIGNKIEK